MLVVNLFAGPGAGKSTTAYGVAYFLKRAGADVELITEFAKDLTWEKRFGALTVQPYVFGKQLMRQERVRQQVGAVITDSPLLLSHFYSADEWGYHFKESVVEIFRKFENQNYFIQRTNPYIPKGRNQNEVEAREIDEKVSEMLVDKSIDYAILRGCNGADADDEAVDTIVANVLRTLAQKNPKKGIDKRPIRCIIGELSYLTRPQALWEPSVRTRRTKIPRGVFKNIGRMVVSSSG